MNTVLDLNKQIETNLIDIIDDLIQDWGLDLESGIDANTLLVNDLEFASVDIIQLCVAVEQFYDTKIGFQDLLMKDGRYIDDLSITELINYIAIKINGDKT
ncbi:MAG: acyl carrier protein [Gammaproteobacteria bacterium]|nr:acyl carrier protein [Gammaproteobacteria bacterium]